MREINLHWTHNRMRKHLCVRFWWDGSPIRGLINWIRHGWNAPEAECKTRPGGHDRCYCPTGSETRFRLSAFGVGMWGWLSRSWTRYPCICDLSLWNVFPESYADEIEDYGGIEKLHRDLNCE